MEAHLERMLNEQNNLCEKIEKLGAFISKNPIFDTLPEEEQSDMHLQLQAMSMYSGILTKRIKRARTKDEKHN